MKNYSKLLWMTVVVVIFGATNLVAMNEDKGCAQEVQEVNELEQSERGVTHEDLQRCLTELQETIEVLDAKSDDGVFNRSEEHQFGRTSAKIFNIRKSLQDAQSCLEFYLLKEANNHLMNARLLLRVLLLPNNKISFLTTANPIYQRINLAIESVCQPPDNREDDRDDTRH